jgi:prepilin-type N-terminal cleavage/methylation domain-containing protein
VSSLHTHRGFTLVELVVSLAIMSILLTAIGSAIVLAGAAIPWDDDPGRPADAALEVAHDMTAELHFALSFAERTKWVVDFTVPSRDADAVPETIRYQWSGTPGDPLTRRYNGGPAVTVIDSVHDFTLVYEKTDFTKTLPIEVESLELELFSYDSSSDLGAAHVHLDSWWSQYFKPVLPAGTIRWAITRVKFMAMQDDDFLTTVVELRNTGPSFRPGSVLYSGKDLLPSDLTAAFQWHELFLSERYLSPDEGISLVFKNESGRSAQLQYQVAFVTQPGLGLVMGNPAWGPIRTDQSLLFYVYGTYTTLGTDDDTSTYLTGVEIEIQTSPEESSEFETAVALLHRPELTE